MIMAGEDSIREVIAFPKTAAGVSPMDDSPSMVDQKQLEELGLQLRPDVVKALSTDSASRTDEP
jgi:aspartyl-tRNA synthetase